MDPKHLEFLAAALQTVLQAHGVERVCGDATWLQNILADYSPQTPALNRVAALAVREGVPAWLTAAAPGQVDGVVSQAVTRLVSGQGIDSGVAHDAVLAWARALGLSTSVQRVSSPVSGPQAQAAGDRVARRIQKLLDAAEAAEDGGRWQEALETYNDILALDAGHAEALQLRSVAQRRLGSAATPVAGVGTTASILSWRASWMQTCGEDTFGRWAAMSIAGVEHKFRWCPPGKFLMGSPESEAGREDCEGPQHEVELTQGLWIGEAPVTQRQWQAVARSNPSRFKGLDMPVEQVSWEDAQAWMSHASSGAGGLGLRFPTEAEWEYAARAGTTGATYRGGNDAATLDAIAWYYANSGGTTHPVKLKTPNPWGLHDTLGNVWEWCADSQRTYTSARAVNPHGGLGGERVFRGGSWELVAQVARAAFRYAIPTGDRVDAVGFRLARGQ
jgi:formylglycine-generating enzyme required for sulfatase activity